MPVQLSQGSRRRFMAAFPSVFNGGTIDVYSGPQPLSADHPAIGTLLAQITAVDGLQFVATSTYVVKEPSQIWTLDGLATGVAGWWRLRGPGYDSGGSTVDYPRIDGLVYPLSDPHAGLVLPTLSLTAAYSREIQQFLFSI